MTGRSQCQRALGAALTLVVLGCPGGTDAPEAPEPDARPERETAISAADTAMNEPVVETVVAPEIVAPTADASEAARDVEVPKVEDAPWLASTISVVDGRLSFAGLPGVSADGMHLALLDDDAGRIAIDVTRLDGKVLVDKVLREPREQDQDPATLQRRFKARIAQAHKVLARAGVHALTPTTVAAQGEDFVVQVPGAQAVTVTRRSLDLPCGRATGVDAAYFDREHGLVVVSVTRDGDCATDEARNDWHVVTLESAPSEGLP